MIGIFEVVALVTIGLKLAGFIEVSWGMIFGCYLVALAVVAFLLNMVRAFR